MSTLISALLDAMFGSLAEATGLSERLRQLLGRDPERLAFGAALAQALTDVAKEFPGRDLRYFTEMLPQFAGPLLVRYLQPAASLPTADELTHLWLNHLTIDSAIVYRQEFTAFATHFLDRLTFHLENQEPLQWIVQARRQRSSESATHRMATAAEQSAVGVAALRQELAVLSSALETALQASRHSAVYTDGGAYVGGDIHGQIVAGRDLTIKNYFVQGLAQLPIDYSVRIENFLHSYLGGHDERVPFGGRSQQLDELNVWLDDPTAPPYYLMVAEAGKGKSALVSRWSAQLATRPDLAVIFVPISIRFQTAAQDVFFATLAGRLARIHETQSPESFHRPTSAEEWKAICESYLRRPLPQGKLLVVILDGLDEATDWAAGPELFAVRPPVGLRILVTARLRARESDALGWAATLQWEGPHLARKTTLPALDQPGVADALNSMGNPLAWLTPQMDVVGKLYQLSQGDPLLVQLYVRELAKAQQRAGFLAPTDLHTIAPGLNGFMQKWWADQRKQWRMQGKDPKVEEEQLLPLLSACAMAVGPLLLSDLAALDETRFGVTRHVANQAELLGRWLIGDGVRQGYIFAHPRLREFFAGPSWLSTDEYTAWQAKFCDWGRRVLIDLKRGNLRPQAVPQYLLRHYATHLTQSGPAPQRFYALISDGWRRAWEAVDVSYGGFLKDVDRTWAQARQAYGSQRPGRGEALAQQVRAALCRSSVAALGSTLPPELLAELVKRRLRTSTEAMAIIKLMPKAEQRVLALAAVAPHLAVEVLDEALAIARASECEYEQHNYVAALCAVAIRFREDKKEEVLKEALDATYAMTDGDTDVALYALVPHLPSSLLADALARLRSKPYNQYRIYEFIAFAKHLSDHELRVILNDIFDIPMLWRMDHHDIPVLHLFATALPASLMNDAVDAARQKPFRNRGLALKALLPHLPASQREQIVEQELNFIRAHKLKGLIVMFAALAPWMSINEREALLSDAEFTNHTWMTDYLGTQEIVEIAPYLTPKMQADIVPVACKWGGSAKRLQALAPYWSNKLLKQAFEIVCQRYPSEDAIESIGVLSPFLPANLLEVALKVVIQVKDYSDTRENALTALLAHLPVNLRLQAVTATNAAHPNGKYSHKSLANLALYLPTRELRAAIKSLVGGGPNLPDDELRIVLKDALSDVSGIIDRHEFLPRLAPLSYLSASEQRKVIGQALSEAHETDHDGARAEKLVILVPHLTGGEQLKVIKEALAAMYAYSDDYYRTWACLRNLSALSPHLPAKLVDEVLTFIHGLKSNHAQAVGLGVLARHFPDHQQNALFTKALNTLCKTDENAGEFSLQHLEPHLTRWAIEQPTPSHAALGENLPMLASKPRSEFMYDLAALMPFILALAGDEAPQAAAGIYHAIQEVCEWWP